MKDNNFADIPDLNQALSLTEQYEEYKYLRVWGVFILIDAIVLLLTTVFFNNLITRKMYFFFTGPRYILKYILIIIQFIILLILVIKIGKNNRRTRLKLGKIYVSPHWAFFCGLIGLKVITLFLDTVDSMFPIFKIGPDGNYFYLILFPLNLILAMTIYYIFIKKAISKHDFKEIKNTIFFLLGWIVLIIFLVFILRIHEYFGWDELKITLIDESGLTHEIYIFVSIVSNILSLIFFICDVILGIIAFKMSKKLLGGEICEKA